MAQPRQHERLDRRTRFENRRVAGTVVLLADACYDTAWLVAQAVHVGVCLRVGRQVESVLRRQGEQTVTLVVGSLRIIR